MESTPAASIYSSLQLQSTRHIRLLKIDDEASTDNISCTLANVSLDDRPSYFALSYCWGHCGNSEKTKIVCNGVTLKATENLIAAMKRLRSTYLLQSFWIDAICINQDDFTERARHVQFMCDIYRLAENVVIHLGEESEGLDRAMGLFHTLHEKSAEPLSDSNTAGMVRSSLSRSSDEVWFRIHDFFNRPWFSRMWVIQEVAVSSVDPVVLCGSHTLSWSAIAKVSRFLRETALTASTIARSRNGNALMIQQFKERPQSLGLLLMTTFQFEATDPRDMIFAFYGIVHPQDRETLSSPYFEVNYEKPVNDVYRDVMMGCLVHYGFVDIMFRGSSSSYHTTIESLPSWVPDWSIPPQHRTVPLSSGPFLSGYKASGGHAAWKGPSGNPSILRIAGKSCDDIIWMAEPFQQGDFELLPHLRRRPQTLEKLWNQVSSRLGDSRGTMEAFWHTLMAGIDRERAPLGPMFYVYFLRFWHQSKHFDQRAIKYWATNPDARPAENEVEQRILFEKNTAEENTIITVDEYESFERCKGPQDFKATKQNAIQVFATSPPNMAIAAPKCIHCFALVLPEVYREVGMWKVEGTSPALAYRDSDPFIADYYRHLENGGEAIITSDEKRHILTHLMNILGNRAFFITRDGKTGLGPWSTKPGDKVVILSGASVPALLRRTGEPKWLRDETDEANPVMRYIGGNHLVGEAYVHGIMSGEAVEEFDWDTGYEVFDLV
ncbi:Heterokaryon incompatibility protein [Hyphodiscus hymeniophilus]|uniref:Heterokaryon incompatibility protein n=1 Tax=Hyphodiscus hymeniophilus TaxID=353542 RepID=A0A9P6VFC9_9HELO|nr:Heterokaryon incompatibility protein [Hyphodiscus hymeniophilus]